VKHRDIISSCFWLAIGIGVCYGAYELDLGTLRNPGSGFMFFGAGMIMVALSLGVLIGTMKETAIPGELKRVFWTEIRWTKFVTVLAALFIYAYVFIPLGFILSTILLLIVLFKAVEPQSWTKAILGAIISTFTAYGVFQLWLGSQLPTGLLGIG
jgi:putative tricarboxylic transport membrane protein